MRDVVSGAAAVGAYVYVAWAFLGVLLRNGRGGSKIQWAWLILKWPSLAAILVNWLDGALSSTNPWWNGLLLGFNLYMWWLYRNAGDDDFRRKLKKRVAEKVQALGHRLVVVPT